MEREIPIEELKKLYASSDMVKADCNGCQGCSDCCRNMGESIVLDPLDVYRLTLVTGQSFEQLLHDKIELHVAEGLILPNLKMTGKEECCVFLNEQGRCSVHKFRPGLCRLFPLGRYYENRSFKYYLQLYECKKKNRSKVKVSKWLDTPDLKNYEKFVADWHFLLKDIQEMAEEIQDETFRKDISMYLLNTFYSGAYQQERDFYIQFDERLDKIRKLLQVLKRG